jgi:hypothetical protein
MGEDGQKENEGSIRTPSTLNLMRTDLEIGENPTGTTFDDRALAQQLYPIYPGNLWERAAPVTSTRLSALCIDADLTSKRPETKQLPNPHLRLHHDVDVETITHPQAFTLSLLCPCMPLPSLCCGKRSKPKRNTRVGGRCVDLDNGVVVVLRTGGTRTTMHGDADGGVGSVGSEQFGRREYWDGRFASEEAYEWCGRWSDVAPLLLPHVEKTDVILVIGCGNSGPFGGNGRGGGRGGDGRR